MFNLFQVATEANEVFIARVQFLASSLAGNRTARSANKRCSTPANCASNWPIEFITAVKQVSFCGMVRASKIRRLERADECDIPIGSGLTV